jgi:hypothetical protein
MKAARLLLALAALTLFATAALHSSGSAMVSGWLEGDKRAILQMLWFVPAVDWLVVAAIWAIVAWPPDPRFAPIIWLTSLIPLAVALMLIAAVGPNFFGIWMLLGAVALAAIGAGRLR